MNDRECPRPNRLARSPILRWHRWTGVALGLILLLVAATGLLLNHAEQLGLRSWRLEGSWWYRWYGFQPAGEPIGFRVGGRWIVGVDGTLFLDDHAATSLAGSLGAVEVNGMLVAAAARELVLLTAEGDLVERLGPESLPPGRIMRLGRSLDGKLMVVDTDRGIHASDTDAFEWKPARPDTMILWSQRETLAPETAEAVLEAYRGEGLTLHRVILDLHTGRFFGRVGGLVVDLAAVGLVFLALSGLYHACIGRWQKEVP